MQQLCALTEVRANAIFTTKKYYTQEYSEKFSLVANASSILEYRQCKAGQEPGVPKGGLHR